ncbi:MAG: type II toxin-antitoxin system VapC family toxin [Abditibacteriales bacterium]|nr:type II toxin-antitoxin system VapC family toxin [Abditibacteriales bacterium]MDW8364660.1 type II toxin-antitoxin system VapC family toxin [Abditibacteriales bacterium]
MNYFYWDASALGKRYTAEVGTTLVNHLFAGVSKDRLMALSIAIGEVTSIMVRRHNAGVIGDVEFAQALAEFRTEVVDAADFRLESVADSLVRASLDFIERYSLNATDGIVLCSALEVANALRGGGDDLVLVASDLRLLRAAQGEGLTTFNPELDTPAQLDALIAS